MQINPLHLNGKERRLQKKHAVSLNTVFDTTQRATVNFYPFWTENYKGIFLESQLYALVIEVSFLT